MPALYADVTVLQGSRIHNVHDVAERVADGIAICFLQGARTVPLASAVVHWNRRPAAQIKRTCILSAKATTSKDNYKLTELQSLWVVGEEGERLHCSEEETHTRSDTVT